MSSLKANELYTFQTIVDFVQSLNDVFKDTKGKFSDALKLYQRLISKTSFQERNIIARHIEVFKHFCVVNRSCILEKNPNLIEPRIEFSDRIFIDMEFIFRHTQDVDILRTTWEYLITLSALLDPAGKAKDLLKSMQQENSKEGEFLNDVMNTIGGAVGGQAVSNPLELVGQLMNSGVVNELVNKSKDLDVNKLMGTMQGLIQNVQQEIAKSDDPFIKDLMQSLGGMMKEKPKKKIREPVMPTIEEEGEVKGEVKTED
jgi:hypothetical protein